MYAVVAPGIATVYQSYSDVERIHKLYPYPKWRKCQTYEQATEFLQRNANKRYLTNVYNYGNTFKDTYVDVRYRITDDAVFYVLDTRRVGRLHIDNPDVVVEYKGSLIHIKLPNIRLNAESISGHMSAVYNLLKLVGDYIDLNIFVPNYSIFYCLSAYDKDTNRSVKIVRDLMLSRLCKVSISMESRSENILEEDPDYDPEAG